MKIEDWLAKYEGQPTSPAVQHVMDTVSAKARIPKGEDYNTRAIDPPVEFLTEVVKLAPRGHGGVTEALRWGFSQYIDSHSMGDYGDMGKRAWASAFQKVITEHGGFVDDGQEAILFVDTTKVETREEDRATNVGARADGAGLFYTGAVNMLYGLPETGKSLMSTAVATQVLAEGGSVLWIDVDHNAAADILGNFEGMGTDRAVLNDPARFRLAQPKTSEEFQAVVSFTAIMRPSLVVLDSLGEALALYDVNPEQEAYAGWNGVTLAAMADYGSCVLVIDHATKSESNPNFALGSQRKKAALNGTMLRAKLVSTLIPGKGGTVKLTISKDRPGGLRRLSPSTSGTQTAAIFTIGTSLSEWAFQTPPANAEEVAATPGASVDEKSDLENLQALRPAPTSVQDVKARMHWSSSRAMEAMRAYRSSFPSS